MHGLVHPTAIGDEPVVDTSQRGQHAAADAGLLGNLANGGLLGGLAELDVALGQRPQHPSASIDTTDKGRNLVVAWPVDAVDDQPAGRCFVHGAQPVRHAARRAGAARFGHGCVAGCLAVCKVLGRTGSATTSAPPPAPTWFGLFAIRHPSDSSWHELDPRTYSPLARSATTFRVWMSCSSAGRPGPHRNPTRLIERA